MRNPFRIRASQRAVSDEQFVRLFAAGALELLNDTEYPRSGLVFLRSAPGGGKTTFLRLLTPGPLKIAENLSDDSNAKPTYDALLKVGAICPDDTPLLGVMVSFTNEYRDLDELEQVRGAFRALVNARVVLATVRATLERCDRSFPEDLDYITARWTPVPGASIPAEASGSDLFEWASNIEKSVYDALDELGAGIAAPPKAHSGFEALYWFDESEFFCAAGPIAGRRVLLLDDLQYLSDEQRKSIREFLLIGRLACGVWVAERMEALAEDDLLSEGALEGRDYSGTIHLEDRWRRRGTSFAKFVSQIAELRARRADGFENRDFFSALAEDLDSTKWEPRFAEAVIAIEQRILDRGGSSPRFNEWLGRAREHGGDAQEKALAWRRVEILIERDIARKQSSFDFGALPEEELREKEVSAITAAAELFLHKECGVPFYFGRQKLAMLASSNVDQFVELAGDLFEEISARAAGRRGDTVALNADRQHAILKKASQRRWEGVPRRLVRGYEARRFLEAVGTFCHNQTYRPTAPYAPGVTGFAITMSEREQLTRIKSETRSPLADLRGMLAALVAHNLLEPKLDHKNKGNRYLVFYLNRLVCARFNLPLGYGGWREKSPKELTDWMARGAAAVKEKILV